MADSDLPPVLEPIQVNVDFSQIVGMTTKTDTVDDAGSEIESRSRMCLEPEPEYVQGEQEHSVHANKQPAERRQLDTRASPGTLSPEDSPLPGQSGLTFDQMVERALAEGGGSPFGTQQLSGHRKGPQQQRSSRTSGAIDRPQKMADETSAQLPATLCDPVGTPPRCDEDEETQEFIGLEERLRRGDDLTEEEQQLCRTPNTSGVGDAGALEVPGGAGNAAQPVDAGLDAAIAWAGLGADRDKDMECATQQSHLSAG